MTILECIKVVLAENGQALRLRIYMPLFPKEICTPLEQSILSQLSIHAYAAAAWDLIFRRLIRRKSSK